MRAFTVQNIIDRALRKADMQHSDFIDADEALDTFNEQYTTLYDLLVTSFENYKVSEQLITLSGNTTDYDLPDDFYKTIGFDYQISGTPGNSNGQYVTLRPFLEAERNGVTGLRAPVPTGTVRHRYVPAPQIYTDLTDLVDGVSGWEEIIVNGMAMEFLGKEESSTTRLERRQDLLMKRITEAAQNRDIGMPHRVADVYKIDVYNQYASLRYQLQQDTVRFFTTEIVTPMYLGVY
jgi:hypothetical protein